MECVSCRRLSHDLTTVTIALKNIKKWIQEKLEIEIPQCFDYYYPGPGHTATAVDVDVAVEVVEDKRELNYDNLFAACLKSKAVVRLERLSLSATATYQNQWSESSTDCANDYESYDIVNNDGQNLESESYIRDVSIQNNSHEDGSSLSLQIITTDLKRISCEEKWPRSRLRTSSKRNVSNKLNSYESRDLKKDIFIEKGITSTGSSKIKPNSSYLIKDNYKTPSKIKKTNLKLKRKRKNTSYLKKQDSLCPECGKVFSCVPYLNLHIRGVHKYKGDKYKAKDQECSHCHKKFTKIGLRNHIRLIHPTDPKSLQRICPSCAMTFKNESGLKKHLATVHNEDRTKLKCSFTDCDREFYWEYQLKAHVKSHSKDINVARPFKCTIEECDKRFPKIEILKLHIEKSHKNQEKSFVCQNENCSDGVVEKCSERFSTQYQLKHHYYSVHNQQLFDFKCTFDGCFQSFKQERHFIRHVQKFHQETNKMGNEKVMVNYKECPICLKQIKATRDNRNLNKHIKVVHGEKEKRSYSCTFANCEKSFSSYSGLKLHNYSVHNHQYEFKCTFDGCFQSYEQKNHLSNHLKYHEKNSIVNEKIIFKECPICLKQINVSRNSANLNQHIKFVHEGIIPYSCTFDNCEKSFKRKENFGYHVKIHHPDHFKPEDYPPGAHKDYTCSECNRKFNNFPALSQHKSVHMKVGTFSCDFCDLKFKRKSFVSCHVQAVHSGLRPFACNYENCDKTFVLKYYLKSHISAVHLGKPRITPKLKK